MTQLQQKMVIPAAMAQKLDVVRRRTLRVRISTALVAAAAVLLAAMAIAMIVDWLATIYDVRWRALLTYSAWATAGVTLGAWAIAAWRHTRRVDQMAAKVDREIPELEERWSTVTEVSTGGTAADVHPAMFKQVSTEAQRWTPKIEADRVVPLDGLIRALLFLTAITTVLGLAVVLDSQRTTVLLKRFWQPYTAISATELTDLPGDLVVGRGESVVLNANLVGAPVTQASLLLEPQEGEAKSITLTPRGDMQDHVTHRLRSVKEPLRYRLRAGDGQTPWFEIVVADRPQLGKVQLKLTPPAYTRKEPKVIHKLPRRVTVLEGSRVEIALKPKQPLRSLRLKLGPDLTEQLTPTDEGWYRWATTLSENLTFQPLLTETHGLDNLRPPTCEIRVRPDKPPVVKILTPNSEMAVRPDDNIPVTFVASDDVGVHFAELLIYDESQKVDGKPAVLDRITVPLGEQQGAVKVKATVDLDLSKYEMTDGSELSFSIRVREDRGQLLIANAENSGGTPSQTSQQGLPQGPSDEGTAASREQPGAMQRADQANAADAIVRVDSQDQPDTPTDPAAANSDQSTARTGAVTNGPQGRSRPAGPNAPKQQANAVQTRSGQANRGEPADPSNASPQVTEPQDADAVATESMQPADIDAPTTDESSNESRTTTTGRQSLVTGSTSESTSSDASVTQPNEEKPNESDAPASDSTDPSAEKSSQSPQASMPEDPAASSSRPSQQSGKSSNNAPQNPRSNSQQSSNQQPPTAQPSTPPPGDDMTRRSLDVEAARSSNSQRMRLKIDEWAGSFDGQQRQKLEVAIAPKLEDLDRALEKAQQLSRSVLDSTDEGEPWTSQFDRDLQLADEQIDASIKVVESLEEETYDTPYAFIGLQLVDIKQAHIGPARRDFWKAMQSKDQARIDATRNGWQHTTRARELLVLLTERFERTKIEYQLADSVQKVKKMYRIFLEDSMALLRPDGEGNRYGRKMVEFDLDDEYLKRLEEVNKMRNDMRKELARILADDPRLLRRFLDAERNRSKILRNELDRLMERQSELNRETRAWTMADEEDRPQLGTILLGRHIESAQDLSIAAAELHDRFETWSPLGKESEDADFQEAASVLQGIATATRELSADGLSYVDEARRAKKKSAEEQAEEEQPVDENPFNPGEAVEEISSDAQQLYEQFTQLEVLLRKIGGRQDRLDIAYFATNRLLETRRLIEQTSAWVRQLKQQQAGNYHRSAEVAQYRLAMQTDSLAGKLADLEQTMAGLLQNQSGMLPKSIAEKIRALLAALDEQAAPNQLAAVYALRRNQLPRAKSRQESALAGLELAGRLYDEMVEASIKELDELPVQDPIASLLEDPTLDELLAQLEQEIPINEAIGIPRRPSNLQIVSDFLRPGGDNALMTGGNARMMLAQMQRQQQMRQQQLERAYRRAVARALNEADAEDLVKNLPRLARETSDWNQLASQLEDDLRQGRDKAPPERYRRAIEQYFRQVSGAEESDE